MTALHRPALLWLCFAIGACAYVISLAFEPPLAVAVLLKVFPILCLITLAFCSDQAPNYLRLALPLSALGDLLLALPIHNGFIYGLAAFLLAQISYAWGFNGARAQLLDTKRKGRLLFVALLCVALASAILPKTGNLLIPVALYLVAIASMIVLASLHSSTNASIFCGALLFVLSDACIAINKFIWPFSASDVAIMTTYYSAQALIVYGVLRYHRRTLNVTTTV